jgi:hypothetical protein
MVFNFLDVITFNGCFHGNRAIEVGEDFYDDDCAYKCTCLEGGFRKCQKRCPIYIDDEQYENCTWGPSPNDSCCTVPICEKANKNLSPIPLDSTTSITVQPTTDAVSNDYSSLNFSWFQLFLIVFSSFLAGSGTYSFIQWYFWLRKQPKAKVPITKAPHSLLTIPFAYKVLHFCNFMSKNK